MITKELLLEVLTRPGYYRQDGHLLSLWVISNKSLSSTQTFVRVAQVVPYGTSVIEADMDLSSGLPSFRYWGLGKHAQEDWW